MNILLSICTILTTKLLAYAPLSCLAQTCGDRSNPEKGKGSQVCLLAGVVLFRPPRRAEGKGVKRSRPQSA